MTDPAARAAEREKRRKALWQCYRQAGSLAVVPSGIFISAMDELADAAAKLERIERECRTMKAERTGNMDDASYFDGLERAAERIEAILSGGEAAGENDADG